ncbi:MAG TPA: DNA gyrase modulator [Thermoplasmata archaeon]|nr:DNA gyrase modulator [Thermoplasmata archaeon]
MIGEDIAESVLKEAGANESIILAEVRLERREKRYISVRAGQVVSIMSGEDSGMNVRVVLPSGIGFSSVNDISKEAGLKLLRAALKQAKNGHRRYPASVSQEPAAKATWQVRQKKPLADLSVDDRVNFIRSVDSSVMKTGVKVHGRFYELKENEITSYFANSEGSRIGSSFPRVKVDAFNVVSAKGETEQSFREWGATGGWEKVEEWDVASALSDEVKMLKKQIEKGRRVKEATYDLVCGPEVVGIASH